MPLENRDIEDGTRLVATYKGQTYTCNIVPELEAKTGRFMLEGGALFKTPSAAAMAITKTSVNGWRFWSVAGVEAPAGVDVEEEPAIFDPPLDVVEDADGSDGEAGGGNVYTPAPKAKRTLKLITRTPNQKGVEDGFVRIFCRACMDGHIVAVEDEDRAGGPLDICPRGHRQDDEALTGAPAAGVA